jgi:hypothetical protein
MWLFGDKEIAWTSLKEPLRIAIGFHVVVFQITVEEDEVATSFFPSDTHAKPRVQTVSWSTILVFAVSHSLKSSLPVLKFQILTPPS